ncbi:hypothetical protein [Rubellicoccus peritrichatus]|uniref:Heparinase II/III-like protein n=1 Tax=Rubellicoccus peritrichatus TaxID=3080537 RepID=A0AAQ3LCY1_9BACT|nr:hypothetical protein [Puniceicoccus sp. CR14]WOO43196.1 hypothetical protein RZN69_08825 [Puniceicoccus sp. CR14]
MKTNLFICNFISFVLLFTGFLFPAKAEKSLPQTDLHDQSPRFTAEQILNGEFPGRKASPVVETRHNTEGFAENRLYSVPPVGVHPRVLFGPDDLPRLRRQFKDSAYAAEMLRRMREQTAANLSGFDGWGSEVFNVMSSGDIESFSSLWNDPRNPKNNGPPGHGTHPFLSSLVDKAFLSLLDEDVDGGRKVAAAVATFAAFLQPRVEEAAKETGSENYFLSVRNVMGDSATVGFMYDFAQPFMTPDQIAVTRKLIATATKDRYGLGMDLPPHWINWNFIGMGLYYPLLALSIEGEEGFDPRIYKRGCEVARNYMLYSNSANGVGKEAIGYHTSGIAHAGLMMLAMANRGENLFTLERWRSMLDTWAIYAMQPYGGEWQSSGDLGTFPPNFQLVETARFLFPSDQRIGFIEQNLPDKRRLDKTLDIRFMQLLCPPDLDGDLQEMAAADFNLPETLFDEERGMLFSRTGWGTDDLSLQIACRSDTTFHSHDHPDRGAFYLTSHGQAWAVSSMRMTETQYLNQITIDGRGQGYFPTPGEWIEMSDTSEATLAVMDLKYCYDWKWQATVNVSTEEQLNREPWLEGYDVNRDRLLSRFPRELWERDPSPVVRDYYEGYMAGNPRMWTAESSWVVRAPHYPVEKAFRSILLEKGKRPYVLIVDDIKKDNTERLYNWHMRMPNWIEAYDISANEALLGRISDKRDTSYSVNVSHNKSGRPLPQKGQPMLQVYVLQANQPSIPAFQNSMALETLGFVKHDDTHQFAGREMGMAKRLVVPSRSVEPAYKILLFPHRHGEELPKVVLSDDHTRLSVEWSDQQDFFDLTVNERGRTVISKSEQN